MDVRSRLDGFLAERDLDAAWFARPNSFAWLTGGDNVVARDEAVGVAAAGYDGDEVTVVTDAIEAPRLREEELGDDVGVVAVPWYEDDLATAVAEVSPRPAAADFDVPGFDRVDASSLRQPLTDEQVETYRGVAEDAAAALESVCRAATASDTEREVAADLHRALAERGLSAPVVLVGGGERAQTYRHYTPKDVELGSYVLASVTAERDGLYASCTRTVAFNPPDWLAERTRKAARVEATALAATRSVGRVGGTAGDVFDAVRDAYDAIEWGGEWENHHQGGAAGYAGREWIATPTSDASVRLPQGYAWNPTIEGAKSEDTHLVDEDGEVELLTSTGEWPTVTVEAAADAANVAESLTLERHGILRS